MITINIYQQAIEFLTREGFNILQVMVPDSETMYFVTYEFQESYFSNAQSIDSNSFKGIDITTFMKNNANNPQMLPLVTNLTKYLEKATLVRCSFSKDIKWMKWSSANN